MIRPLNSALLHAIAYRISAQSVNATVVDRMIQDAKEAADGLNKWLKDNAAWVRSHPEFNTPENQAMVNDIKESLKTLSLMNFNDLSPWTSDPRNTSSSP